MQPISACFLNIVSRGLRRCSLFNKTINRFLHWLDDKAEWSPEALGKGRWIPGGIRDEPAVEPRPDLDFDRVSESCSAEWQEGPEAGASGVCRLKGARVRMLLPYPDREGHVDDRRRLARVFVNRFRFLAMSPRIGVFLNLWRRLRRSPSRLLERDVRIRGRVALLGNAVRDYANYYHFWLDSVGDIVFLMNVLPEDRQPERFILSYIGAPWQDEVLRICGVDRERIIPFTHAERLRVDELLVPVRGKGSFHFPAGLIDELRALASPMRVDATASRKIYLSRVDSSRRPVENEDEVRRLLTEQGFEILVASELSVEEQRRAFAEASVVVSPHGAGLTNLIWCEEGAQVIELVPERHLVPCFRDIARERRLRYQCVVCEQAGGENGMWASMHVPVEALRRRIEHLPAGG